MTLSFNLAPGHSPGEAASRETALARQVLPPTVTQRRAGAIGRTAARLSVR